MINCYHYCGIISLLRIFSFHPFFTAWALREKLLKVFSTKQQKASWKKKSTFYHLVVFQECFKKAWNWKSFESQLKRLLKCNWTFKNQRRFELKTSNKQINRIEALNFFEVQNSSTVFWKMFWQKFKVLNFCATFQNRRQL